MLPGPVFNVELITTSRRPRYYLVRFLYGLVLLAVIYENNPAIYPSYYGPTSGVLTIQQMAQIGKALFTSLIVVQSIAVLTFTPALVAGVVAEEKRRKTLHYLLSSRLSSVEIILGKVAARLLHMGVFLAIGLPILSILSLFGGVDPLAVVFSFVASLTSAFFLASIAILVSVNARRPREAISLTYAIEAAWFFIPTMFKLLMPGGGPYWSQVYEWIKPINDWIVPTSPFGLLAGGFAGWSRPLDFILEMMARQVVYGLVLLFFASVLLRPVFRREGGGRRLFGKFGKISRKRRLLGRPPCGDDAMLWKERYVSRTTLGTKIAATSALLIGWGLLAYLTEFMARPAVVELIQAAYGTGSSFSHRNEFNTYLRVVCTCLYVFWMLAVASASSTSLTSEREEDTWISLVSTPLSGLEIIRGKMFGAFWSTRWVALFLFPLWGLGMATGAVHPVGIVLVAFETVVFLWFVTALGTYLSLRAKTSARAMITTLAILIFINGVYLMCFIPAQMDSSVTAFGVTPMIEALSLVSGNDLWKTLDEIIHGSSVSGSRDRQGEMVLTCALGTWIYTCSAILLTWIIVIKFDAKIGRPTRLDQGLWNRPNPSKDDGVGEDKKPHPMAPESEVE
ncbi:ABC transporter permease subunit [Singulisphaera rosea]